MENQNQRIRRSNQSANNGTVSTEFDILPKDASVILVVGAPGSQKSEYCKRIANRCHGFTSLSMGDLLRKEIDRIKDYADCHWLIEQMHSGECLPTNVCRKILYAALRQNPNSSGYVIEGYPRSLEQAEDFEKTVERIDLVVLIDRSEQVCLSTLRARAHQAGDHKEYHPNDNPEAIERRMSMFKTDTLPMLKYFDDKGKLKVLAGGDEGQVFAEVVDFIDNLLFPGLSLATFRVSATAEESSVTCCCFWSFKGRLEVDWETLPKVFGVTVTPREGKALGFKKNGTVIMTISGKVLPGGDRDERSDVKISDWKTWDEMSEECQPGDVVGADWGAFRHYGIVERVEPDGTVIISNLVGTAGGLLSKHGIGGGVKEVYSALTGSHGDIAGVTTQTLEEFAEGDKCRVENLMDDEWKSYQPHVILNRIKIATGFRDYSLFEFNCEHYANLIRYGMPYSAQIETMQRKLDIAERGKLIKSEVVELGKTVSTEFSAVKTSVMPKNKKKKNKKL